MAQGPLLVLSHCLFRKSRGGMCLDDFLISKLKLNACQALLRASVSSASLPRLVLFGRQLLSHGNATVLQQPLPHRNQPFLHRAR